MLLEDEYQATSYFIIQCNLHMQGRKVAGNCLFDSIIRHRRNLFDVLELVLMDGERPVIVLECDGAVARTITRM